MNFERSHRRFHELNLTALIDIVFHLMVFVMLTTSFVVSESMELSLPSAKTQGTGSMPTMRLQLSSGGTVTADGVAYNLDQITQELADRLAQQPDLKIAVFTTPGVSVQQLVYVLDAVYLTGGRNVQVDKVE
jgi:biopolymer transport protein ExbD